MRRPRIRSVLVILAVSFIVAAVIFLPWSRNLEVPDNRTVVAGRVFIAASDEHLRTFRLEATQSVRVVQEPSDDRHKEEPLFRREQVSFKNVKTNLNHKLVHIDLKGAPLKLKYLKSILPSLRTAGATGLLMEYEDMFPFVGILEKAKAANAYDRSELQDFLEATKEYNLEVVPLVQTFGHLEFLLKLKEFRQLRELDAFADSICPSKIRSMDIIKEIIDQVLSFHLESIELNWIHIGCDEVYHINKCNDCTKRNLSDKEMFANHIIRVAHYIRNKYSDLTPLIWDDMLRGFLPTELESSELGSLVQPMVWIYHSSITALVPHRVWYLYTKMFDGVWIASAFKGASGSTRLLPSLKKNFANNNAWMNFATGYKVPGTVVDYNFRGIALTGWSRYHHFAVLCELFPPALPSLLLNLIFVNSYLEKNSHGAKSSAGFKTALEDDVFPKWTSMLQCPNKRNFQRNGRKRNEFLEDMERKLSLCSFGGNRLYNDIENLSALESDVLAFHIGVTYKNDGLLQYNKDHRTIVWSKNQEAVETANGLRKDLVALSGRLRADAFQFYDGYTIEELIEYKLKPIEKLVTNVINATAAANSTRVWMKRPFM